MNNKPIYHVHIGSKSGKNCKSIVASAAYRANEDLHCDKTGRMYKYHKDEVVFSEIILPQNAAKRYKNREILWNEVQAKGKTIDAKYAVDMEIAVPNTWDDDTVKSAIRELMQPVIDKGYIADWAYHKKDDNHHVHILIVDKPIDKTTGEISTRQLTKKEYAKDADGNRIPIIDPETGKQKIDTKNRNRKLWKRVSVATNWIDEKSRVKEWRAGWAEVANKRLTKEQQIDHRSYRERGIEKIPTRHRGQKAEAIHNRYLRGDDYKPPVYVSHFCDEDITRICNNYRSIGTEQADLLVNEITGALQTTGMTRQLEHILDRLDRGYIWHLQQQLYHTNMDLQAAQKGVEEKNAKQPESVTELEHSDQPELVRIPETVHQSEPDHPSALEALQPDDVTGTFSLDELMAGAREEMQEDRNRKRGKKPHSIDFSAYGFDPDQPSDDTNENEESSHSRSKGHGHGDDDDGSR